MLSKLNTDNKGDDYDAYLPIPTRPSQIVKETLVPQANLEVEMTSRGRVHEALSTDIQEHKYVTRPTQREVTVIIQVLVRWIQQSR